MNMLSMGRFKKIKTPSMQSDLFNSK